MLTPCRAFWEEAKRRVLSANSVRRPNAGSSSRRRRDPQIVDRRNRKIPRPCAASRPGEPAQPVRRRRVRRFHPQIRRVWPPASMPSCTAFSSAARCAAPPNCGRSACRFPAPGRGRDQRREAVAEPRRRLGAASPHAARRAQSRLPAPAHGVPCREPAHAAAGAQIRRRAVVRFRRRGRRGRILAADAAVGDARTDVRRPRLRDGDARSANADAASCDRDRRMDRIRA